MERILKQALYLGGALLAIAALTVVPFFSSEYVVGLFVGLLSYVVLASAWALFSGPTRYVSLATVAFYGVGAYTVAVLAEHAPFAVTILAAAAVGLVLAVVVGLVTLRLAGIYFVVFTFGLAELVRQLITWFETTVTHTLGRYVFFDVSPADIYWMLLALAVLTIGTRWALQRTRYGMAIHALGDDEVVARHAGVNVTAIKLALFVFSSMVITLAGAVQAPRWTYIEPSIVFNPTISFITLIMALVGGAGRVWGPVFGAVPLYFFFEWLSVNFPDQFYIALGLAFVAAVFLVPNGLLALATDLRSRLGRREAPHA